MRFVTCNLHFLLCLNNQSAPSVDCDAETTDPLIAQGCMLVTFVDGAAQSINAATFDKDTYILIYFVYPVLIKTK